MVLHATLSSEIAVIAAVNADVLILIIYTFSKCMTTVLILEQFSHFLVNNMPLD